MTTSIKLFDLCQRIRPELACLGELGRPLLDVVTVIERLGGTQTITVLSQPGFALDVLTAGNGSDAASVGKVLDFLRIRADAGRRPRSLRGWSHRRHIDADRRQTRIRVMARDWPGSPPSRLSLQPE